MFSSLYTPQKLGSLELNYIQLTTGIYRLHPPARKTQPILPQSPSNVSSIVILCAELLQLTYIQPRLLLSAVHMLVTKLVSGLRIYCIHPVTAEWHEVGTDTFLW